MIDLLGLPVLASEHGAQIDKFIFVIHVFMLVTFLVGSVFLAVPLVRYRRGANPVADYVGLRTKTPYLLAVAMGIMDAVLMIFFSIPFWEEEISSLPGPEDNAYEVRVQAQQFTWYFHYPGPDGVFGATAEEFVDDQTNPVGLDPKDPNGKDDITPPILHLPVDREVLIHLTSRDVIHSFNLPEFRVKQDIIPGMSIPVHFKPTMTTASFRDVTGKPERNFEIACAQLCGLNHFSMRGTVVVETEAELQAWYDEELAFKQEYDDDDFWN